MRAPRSSCHLAETLLANVSEESVAQQVIDEISNTAKQLAEADPGTSLEIKIPAISAGLTAEDVTRLLTEHDQNRASAAKQLQEQRDCHPLLYLLLIPENFHHEQLCHLRHRLMDYP